MLQALQCEQVECRCRVIAACALPWLSVPELILKEKKNNAESAVETAVECNRVSITDFGHAVQHLFQFIDTELMCRESSLCKTQL